MVEIFALLLIVVAFMVVVPMMFPKKKPAGNSIAAMKAEVKNRATGSFTPSPAPQTRSVRTVAGANLGGLWREVAVTLVTLLQAGIGVGVLYFAYEIYQTTPTAGGNGGVSSLNFFAQFWLGTMFLAAVAAFGTGIFTFLKQPRQVMLLGGVQIVLGGLFLMLGNWALPLAAALIVFALCSMLVAREAAAAASALRGITRPEPAHSLHAVTTAQRA